jgi:hypothetical protein
MINFPDAPVYGETYNNGAASWTWDGVKWTAGGVDISVDTINRTIAIDLSAAANPNNVIPEIQAAVDSLDLTGGHILLSPGNYKATGDLVLKSNILLEGHGTTLDYSAQTSGNFMTVEGTIGAEVPISVAMGRADYECATTTAHGAVVENDYLIVSQRNALHSDSADLQLGDPVAGAHATYFAEPVTVKKIVSSTQFEFTPPLRWSGYQPAGHGDTVADPGFARPSATVQKVNWTRFVKVKGIRFIAGGGTNRLAFDWAKYCRVEQCHFEMADKQGVPVYFFRSHICEANQCTTRHSGNIADVETEFPENHAYYTPYKVVSGWNCGFQGCVDINGTQGFDITYSDYDYPSVGAYINNCRSVGNGTQGATAHSGCYGVSFTNNQFVNCRSGIQARSRMSVVTDNVLIGWGRIDDVVNGVPIGYAYGIAVSDGWSQESVISGNTIDNFPYGIRYANGTSQGPGRVDGRVLISDNQIKYCSTGIWLENISTVGATAANCNVRVSNNSIYAPDTYGIYLDQYINGASVDGNYVSGPFRYNEVTSAGIFQSNNSADNRISRNMFVDLGTSVAAILSDPQNGIAQTDLTTFPLATYPHLGNEYTSNRIIGAVVSTNSAKDISLVRDRVRKWNPVAATVAIWERQAGAVMYLVADNAGQPTLYFGSADSGTEGGIGHGNSTGTLSLRAGGATRLSISGLAVHPGGDNTITLGRAGDRWSVVYAASGTISTSDEREKEDVADIDEAALRAVSRISFSQFKFRDAVERKGDGARLHFGALGQQVREAFEAEGLDAFRYGVLCYDEWDTEYEDALDNSGEPTGEKRVVTQGGSRLGVRYDELFALKLAALEAKQ